MAHHSPLMILMIAELDKRGILYEERDATIVCPSLKIKLHPDPVNPNSDVKIYVIDSWRYLSCYLGLFHGIDFQVEAFVQKHLEGVAGQS